MEQYSLDLSSIGASAAVYGAFEPYDTHGLILGRVSVVHRGQYLIFTSSGEARAEAIGTLLYNADDASELPAVGDWVAAQQVGPAQAMVHAVLPRRTVFSRRAPGTRHEQQVVAANIDLVFVVCGLDGDFNVRRIERYLTLARESGAEAAVVLNKVDLCGDLDARIVEVEKIAAESPVICVSAQTSDGVEPLRNFIASGRTVALLGSSGVGKSTIVNQLLGENRQQVREVRESDSRGRHTTTHRELLPLPGGGALIDTPGMRELQLWAGQGSLDSAFSDIAEFADACRFRDCTHTVENGCAVQAAIRDGTLDPERGESYQKLRAEVAFHERKTDILAAQEVKRRWKNIHKAMRGFNRGG